MNLAQAKEWIGNAPQAESRNADLIGWYFNQGGAEPESRETNGGPWYICASCSARLQARGCGWSMREASPVWTGQPHVNCEVCGKQ